MYTHHSIPVKMFGSKHKLLRKLWLLAVIALVAQSDLWAQTTVRGKVSDENGEAMISATVLVKSNRTIGAITDFDGNFSITIPETEQPIILISMMGYTTIEDTIKAKKGEVVLRNYGMQSAVQDLVKGEGVEIVAKASRSKDTYMENVKLKSATTLDYISSETMKKTGDVSVVSAIARVPGVSTNGNFITVRGIGDRYVKTSINGSRIPTLDPFTNNIKLDLFPTSLVDNIIITKTASPDLPGDWAGAYISVETKDYPDRLTVTAEATMGYNPNATFKNIATSQHSKTDWLGFDNGYRDYDHSSFVAPNVSPDQYQQFVALGLGDYYKSLGVTSNWLPGTTYGDVLYKLGLVQLGLLPRAMFNDEGALNNAKSLYASGHYADQAFNTINEKAAKSGQAFSNNWSLRQRLASPNFGLNFSIGNQVNVFKQPLGFLVAFRYNSTIMYDANATINREDIRRDSMGEPVVNVTSLTDQKFARETNAWSALVNLAYKFNPNNSVSLLFMPNFMGVNNIRDAVDNADDITTKITKSQFYEQRRQLVYQLKTEHYLPGPKVKIELNASYTAGQSKAPDFKNLNYSQDIISQEYQIGGGGGSEIQRYYRYLTDNLFDSRLSAELPLSKKTGVVRKLKAGVAYQYNHKRSDQYVYDLFLHPDHQKFIDNSIDAFFSIDNFGIGTGNYQGTTFSKINAWYQESSDPANHTFGYSKIFGAFVMTDYAITPALRASGGLRAEKADIFADVIKYHELGYAKDDLRRISRSVLANPGGLNEWNFLPSANLVYQVRKSEKTPMNLRLNYSYTVARPSIRELSETLVFDYELRALVFGNSQLKAVKIHNIDLRFESYFKGGHNISASVFYKEFRNHIELVNYEFYTWQNVDKSRVMGVELEGKVTLVKNLELRANVAYIYSQSKFIEYTVGTSLNERIPVDTLSRNMFGQAPYVLNGILSYNSPKLGLTLALSYNVQGPRLVISGVSTGGRPDVYERPRHLLDFKITKTIGKYFSLNLTARNLLNSPFRRSFRFDGNWFLDYDKYTTGTDFVLGVAFKL